ncbi:MAG: rRNA (guanine966-N2)-methyltransferase [Thermosediminibacterales bacterium]|nr:rRNA (guanine966-N2)-methyltransferase [Thermosediminibacterales bacterium]MDK2835441.1 rRNA (guanine966-N2)-methyltransferase [Thermosediminibacterales bacterium]
MRIIAGKARGRLIKSPKGMFVRPTSDKVKESLFNIIAPYIIDCVFLDLFAGSGSIGIEAISRGATKTVFVEKSGYCIKVLKENLNCLGFLDRAQVIKKDVELAIKELSKINMDFDIVFMDPPYKKNIVPRMLEKLSNYKLVKQNGIVVAEHSLDTILPETLGDLKKIRYKKYGKTVLTFFGRDDAK